MFAPFTTLTPPQVPKAQKAISYSSDKRRRRRVEVAALVSVLVTLTGCRTSGPAPEEIDEAKPHRVGLVDIGNGRSIHMECRGSGWPTVIFVAGQGERADNFMITSADPLSEEGSVFSTVAGFTRVCAYDRPGTATATGTGFDLSRSTPLVNDATVGDSAEDLARLLRASGAPGPYVLVGHSLGGPIVRLYAAAHPEQVAGLVFIDAMSEGLIDELTPAQLGALEELSDPEKQGRPPGSERLFYATAVAPLLRDAPAAPRVPTIILTADQWPLTAEAVEVGQATGTLPAFVTLEFSDAVWAAQRKAQKLMAAKFPGAQHITETDATHYIHLDNPRLVIDSIRNVVEQVRAAAPR